ncbi:MAG: type II secretion system protein, partial [Phycisphaerae bacterium]|nr:type II secretion system protein [Phycisphaerae bacterium]
AFELEESARATLVRNVALLVLLVPGIVARTAGRRSRATDARPARSARGFTVVELLVVMALAGVLVALVLPSLAGVRLGARTAASAANARTHAGTMASYLHDWRDVYPYLTDPQTTQSVIRCRSAGRAIVTEHFGGAKFRWLGLADDYYDGNWLSPSFRSPFGLPGAVGSYTMGCVFLARPEYYTPETRRQPPEQLRPTRGADVLFPGSKAIVVDDSAPPAGSGLSGVSRHERFVIAAMVDGRAGQFNAGTDMLPQHPSGDGNYPAYGADFPWWLPMTHTAEGVRGRDIR